MPADFIHSVIVEDQDPAADAILSHELPVNPLSGLLLHLKPLNNTGTIANYHQLVGLLDALNSITITWRGITVFSASGQDAYQLLLNRWHRDVIQNGQNDDDDDRRSLILPILFGRFWGDRDEGLPVTRSGELILQLDVDIASGGYDDLRYTVEALELPNASPKSFTRVTTISQTFAATGNNDVVLPVGHAIRGLLCFQTTPYEGATPTPGLGRLAVIRDGREVGYTSTDVEVQRAVASLLGRPTPQYDEHDHWAVIDDTVDVFTEPANNVGQPDDKYVYLDFDFLRDDTYNLDTVGANRLVLRSTAEVAEAMRIIPVEKVGTDFLKAR